MIPQQCTCSGCHDRYLNHIAPPPPCIGLAYQSIKAIAAHEESNKRWQEALGQLPANGKLPQLPFVCTPAQVRAGTQRAEQLAKFGMLPKEVAYMQFDVVFTTPGWLKLHDRLILLGPILKYLLHGFFEYNERSCLFR